MTLSLGKRTNTDTAAVVRWMDAGAARTDPEPMELAPIQPVKQRLHAAWRENAQSRIVELDVEIDCLIDQLGSAMSAPERRRLAEAKGRLRAADSIVKRRPGLRYAWTGVDVARALAHINAVDVTLTRLSPPNAVAAKLPDIIAGAALLLKPHDARMDDLRRYAAKEALTDEDRGAIAQDVRAIYAACAAEHVQARSFRNLLFGATLVLALFAVGIGLLGWSAPGWFALCAPAHPTAATCPTGGSAPTGGDVFLVEVIGLFSAGLMGSVAIRRMRGSATPYAIPMASLLVKLPTGALTALAGLLLIRAGVLGPDVAAAGSAQFVAYALIFGGSQQAFTRLIDIQTQNVLDSIPTPNRDAAKPPNTAARPEE